jgi:hypothetical protein
MQFFFLLLFNVFLAAVMYLVISLKLERSATEFRERRLRKEMDEIIKEFNMTAERNISILESRIGLLRKLLEKTGDMKSLDITMAGDELDSCRTEEGKVAPARMEYKHHPVISEDSRPGPADGPNNAGAFIKKGLLLFFEKIIHILQPRIDGSSVYRERADNVGELSNDEYPMSRPEQTDIHDGTKILIEKDLSKAMPGPIVRNNPLTEEEIIELASLSDDRYQLVTILFEKGCAIEDISKYSGIPVGEVRLVLNLNLNRETSSNTYKGA